MDGVFCRQKFLKFQNILGLVSGIILILLFGFFVAIGEFDTLDTQIASWFFLFFGFFTVILCSVSLYVNQRVYIHVDEETISAFCHLGLTLHCNLSDVSGVSYGGAGLNIKLKNGKKYNLMYLENAYAMGKYIQRRITSESAAPVGKEQLLEMVPSLKKRCIQKGITSIVCFLLLFPEIFLAAALTGWKDLDDFHSGNWTVFTIMACVGVITIAVSCVLLRRCLLDTEELNKLQGMLYQTILRTSPIQPGNAIKLFIDDNVSDSFRLTVYGYPNSEEVYFTIEQVNQNFECECIHISKVYPCIDDLAPEIIGLTEIALP